MKSVVCTGTNPIVIAWARTTLNIDLARAARRANVSEDALLAFERGEQSPTLAQLRALAQLYKRPVAVFFLPAPPPSVKRPRDYRAKSEELTRETLLSFRRARNVQEAIRLLADDVQPPIFWTKASTPTGDADNARRWLGITDEEQLSAKDAAEFFRLLANRLNDRSIQVLLHSYPTADAKAYGLADAPATIVISTNDKVIGSRLFSLLHELCHLSHGDSGLCVTQDASPYAQERTCDLFAVQALMPERLVRRLTGAMTGTELADAVDGLADQIKSSKSALLIRFEELGLITGPQLRAKLREIGQRTPAARGGRSTRTAAVIRSSGRLLADLVFRAYSREQLSPIEASRILNINQAHLQEVGSALGYL